MATIVCQGLQSCLEPQICEPRTTLRLKLSSQRLVPHLPESLQLAFKSCVLDSNAKPIQEMCHSEKNPPQVFPDSDSDNNHNSSSNADPDHSWSFLDAITNGGQMETNNKADKDQNVYVHPLSKRSSSTLSEKSLELCTENLGSETGTDIMEDSNIFSSSSSDSESGNFATREQEHSRQLLGANKKASKCRSSSFPPPLTTITGVESLQVRTHREDGRLIIKAVKAPSPHSLFQAERSHGRLRLSIFKDSFSLFDSEEPAEEEEEMSTDETSDIDDDTTNEDLEKEEETHENNLTNSEEEEGVEDGENVAYRKEEMDGNKLEVGVEMGIRKKLQRTGRCKEGESSGENKNIGLLWEPKPVWVATS